MTDGALRNAKLGGEILLTDTAGRVPLSDGGDHFIGELGAVAICSALHARLHACIRHVVRLSTEKEMIGANAGAGVAVMADESCIGDWAVRQFVRNTVSTLALPIDFNRAVSVLITTPKPKPTSVRIRDPVNL